MGAGIPPILPLLEKLSWCVYTAQCPREAASSHLSIPFWKDHRHGKSSCSGWKYVFTVVLLSLFLLSKHIRKGLNHLHRPYHISSDYSTDSITLIHKWNEASVSKTSVSTYRPTRLGMNSRDLAVVFINPVHASTCYFQNISQMTASILMRLLLNIVLGDFGSWRKLVSHLGSLLQFTEWHKELPSLRNMFLDKPDDIGLHNMLYLWGLKNCQCEYLM